jgi:hypothetical protein
MAEKIEKSLLDLDFAALTRRTFTPSPSAWEDQVLYFLLLDRFSDGKETGGYRDNADHPVHNGVTPLYRAEDSGRVDYDAWLRAGGDWQGGTLTGHCRRRNGILRNETYVGRLVWNRQQFIKDPQSGKRIPRVNPESEWVIHQVPHLQIIAAALWDRVEERLEEIARQLNSVGAQ